MSQVVSQDSSNQLSPNAPNHSTHSPQSLERLMPTTGAGTTLLQMRRSRQESSSPSIQDTGILVEDDEPALVCEGTSSFSAHSIQAIAFLSNVAGIERMKGHVFDTSGLLDSLYQIVNGVKTQRPPASSTSTNIRSLSTAVGTVQGLPPIQASVKAIQAGKGR